MAQQTNISYAAHSWNPWWGCRKIRSGCQNCYAETFARQYGHDCWGDSPRRMLSDAHWKEPLKWNRAAEKAGERPRVLVSMCDPFEDREELLKTRYQFLALIGETPALDWLLWTKRPAVAARYYDIRAVPDNAWLGVSCSTQKDVDEMIPLLLQIPASVLAVSLEPLVEEVDLSRWLCRPCDGVATACRAGLCLHKHKHKHPTPVIGWVIVGGESGPKRRPFKVDWAQNLYSECRGICPFYMKQDSHFRPGMQGGIPDELWKVKEVPKTKGDAT